MELIVFDLDGTLLNRSSELSTLTRQTLCELAERGIAYTVATGRTLHAARSILEGHHFNLPHIYQNGVMIWQPDRADYSHMHCLNLREVRHLIGAIEAQGITPFISSLEPGNHHMIYHPPLQSEVERQLVADFLRRDGVQVLPIEQLTSMADITNISALGPPAAIDAVAARVAPEPALVAYAGIAIESAELKWIDVHHAGASKGRAVSILREQLGASKVLCFGDSDNDLSLFAEADESYAPANAKDCVKAEATEVIGHHDEDGVALFLRSRFDLPS